MPTVVAIDDDRSVRHLITRMFEETDIDLLAVESPQAGIKALREQKVDAVLLDIMLGEMSGLDVFKQLRAVNPRLPIIFLTGRDDSATAIEAMKLGAFDFVVKPIEVQKLRDLVARAIRVHHMAAVPVQLPASPSREGDLLVGRSPAMLEVYKQVGQVAPEDVTVLIRGESGTGKELVARAIYQHSRRAEKPFLAVNCAAIPENLLESELFGHEKGSFTGAAARRIGKFEQCDGGTIFLDEVGDMAPALQGKVLRLLQEQRFERVGGNETIQTDVRIIAATNRDLEKMCEQGAFRPDLFFRLNGFTINLPPLRERGDDLPVLIDHFFARFRHELVKKVEGLSPEAMNILTAYPWPGNVRELQSVLRQAMLQATSPLVVPECLPEHIQNGKGLATPSGPGATGTKASPTPTSTPSTPVGAEDDGLLAFIESRMKSAAGDLYAQTLAHMERQLLTHILRATDGNQSEASRILGITRGSLRNKLRAHGIVIDNQAVVGPRHDDAAEPAATEA